ncbi:hypothetical protein BJF78_20185 [Pseudonocardia sp. CNS-139]|nr:hypothetical protein BJF78_20185 [Pseudonocardia sp. CNS-139]
MTEPDLVPDKDFMAVAEQTAGRASELSEEAIVKFRAERPEHGWRVALYKARAGWSTRGSGRPNGPGGTSSAASAARCRGRTGSRSARSRAGSARPRCRRASG